MELADLTVFRTVVRAGGVTRAAEQLHRVQSNVTTRVRKLEEELGVELFVREGRRMQLSASGKVLLEYADRILLLVDEAREALVDGSPRGVLRLGAMESTAAIRLPLPLSQLHQRFPQLKVELHTGDPQSMLALLVAGQLDAALVAEPVNDARIQTLPIYDEELVLVTSASHPPIGKPRDLQTGTLLAFHPGCPHRLRLESGQSVGGDISLFHHQAEHQIAALQRAIGVTTRGVGRRRFGQRGVSFGRGTFPTAERAERYRCRSGRKAEYPLHHGRRSRLRRPLLLRPQGI